MTNKLENAKDKFHKELHSMIKKFIKENKVVSIGDRVYIENPVFASNSVEYEITEIKFDMTNRGSLLPYLPMINYWGKPVNKKSIVMENRKQELLLTFKVKNSFIKYRREHVCHSLARAAQLLY